MRPRLGHRVVGVGGREQARRQREVRAGDTTVIAGAVEALVVRSGDRRERRQELRAREDALGVVGVEPHLLDLVRRQRPGFLPDPHIDGHPPEVVDERRAAHGADAGVVEPATLRRRRGQLRHASGVTGEVRRHQIGEVAHGGERAVERLALEQQWRLRLAGERLVPDRTVLVQREDPRRHRR